VWRGIALVRPRGYTGGLQGIGAIASRRKFHACCTTLVPRDLLLHPNMVVRLFGDSALFLPSRWHGFSATASHHCLCRIGPYTKFHFLTQFPIRRLSQARTGTTDTRRGGYTPDRTVFRSSKLLFPSSGSIAYQHGVFGRWDGCAAGDALLSTVDLVRVVLLHGAAEWHTTLRCWSSVTLKATGGTFVR
jgi:hypothetical protein